MKLFVWDLHGVLEKGTEQASVYVSNLVLEEFGYSERLNANDGKHLFGKRWYEYFQYLLPEESNKRHLELADKCFTKADNSPELFVDFVFPNDHSHFVLEEISKKHHQILISNTKSSSLVLFLKALKMEKYFTGQNAYAAYKHGKNLKQTKHDILKKFLKGKKFEDIIIIGDSENDMTLSKVAGGKTYLFTPPETEHREIYAAYKIHDLREVLKEL